MHASFLALMHDHVIYIHDSQVILPCFDAIYNLLAKLPVMRRHIAIHLPRLPYQFIKHSQNLTLHFCILEQCNYNTIV